MKEDDIILRPVTDAQTREIYASLWMAHSRRCRRSLDRKHVPHDTPEHIVLCECGWPQARIDAWRREALKAQQARDDEPAVPAEDPA